MVTQHNVEWYNMFLSCCFLHWMHYLYSPTDLALNDTKRPAQLESCELFSTKIVQKISIYHWLLSTLERDSRMQQGNLKDMKYVQIQGGWASSASSSFRVGYVWACCYSAQNKIDWVEWINRPRSERSSKSSVTFSSLPLNKHEEQKIIVDGFGSIYVDNSSCQIAIQSCCTWSQGGPSTSPWHLLECLKIASCRSPWMRAGSTWPAS